MKSLSMFSAVVLSACGTLLSNPVSATTVSFSLGSTPQLPFSGAGYASLDGTLVPSGFTGSVTADYIFFTFSGGFQSGPFGTDYGNIIYGYDPQGGGVAVTRPVTAPASVSFKDGQATGINYSETHSCTGIYHCEPNVEVVLSGSNYTAFAYPAGGFQFSAPLVIAVPEPSTAALLAMGALLLAVWKRRDVAVGLSL